MRFAIVILLGVAAFPPLAQQTSTKRAPASVRILLPSDIPSEKVQITYHMVGPFGGVGSLAKPHTGVGFYEIPTSADGRVADEIKIIVYAPGCEIQTYDIPLEDDSRIEQEFECTLANTVVLSGQIVPMDLVQDKNAELIVTYMAYWANDYFGIVDGIVPEFTLANVSPQQYGTFQVELPLFSADSARHSPYIGADLQFRLRDSVTWNPIAHDLEPEVPEFKSVDHNVPIRPAYPNGLKFTPGPY